MAKKTTINEKLFSRTSVAEPEEPKNYPISVYLTQEEKTDIKSMAKDAGLSRHALLQFAVRDFMKRFKAGEIKAETETVKVTVLKVQD